MYIIINSEQNTKKSWTSFIGRRLW